jgi:hypothetical protein
MSLRSKLVKVLWKWVAPIAGVSALVLAVAVYFHAPAPRSYRLRLTAGNALAMRHQLALRLQGELTRQNVALQLGPSAGSEQALDWVNRREVDVALVQGGLTSAGRPSRLRHTFPGDGRAGVCWPPAARSGPHGGIRAPQP